MVPNDYDMIYVREMQEFLERSKMVAVFQAQVRFKWKWHNAWQNARRQALKEIDRYYTVQSAQWIRNGTDLKLNSKRIEPYCKPAFFSKRAL